MHRFFAVLKYIKGYWGYAILNIIFNALFSLLSVVSISLVLPFMTLLFSSYEELHKMYMSPPPAFSLSGITSYLLSTFRHKIASIIFADPSDGLDGGKLRALLFICVLVVVTTFVKNVCRYLAMYFVAPIRLGVVRDLRNKLHEKSLRLSLAYYSNERKGDLMSRVTSDVVEIEFGIMTSLEMVFREPLLIIMFLSTMIAISPALTLYVFLLLPIAALFIMVIGRSLRRASHRSKETLGLLFSLVDETLGGIKVIKAFTGEAFIQRKFSAVNSKFYNEALSVQRKTDLTSPLTESLVVGVLMIILFVGGRMALYNEGGLDAGLFITYFAAASQIIGPIKQMTVAYGFIQRGIASEERIARILDAPVDIADKPAAKSMGTFAGSLKFDNVSFAYRKGDKGYVLKDVNLEIPRGKTVALVGQSGSGKTTLADMVPRFYDPDAGAVTIDGTDIRDLKLVTLRSHIGVVTQDSVLFNDTIFNNIAFGMKDADREAVEHAARVANAHDFIMQMPEGYDTNIGDRGSKLSGGQKQRLAIARAVLKDPAILILDEATSALDTESERLVQDALAGLMKNRTSLVIAHRLSTIAGADEIIVMHMGEIVERGTHTELIHRNGTYKKLCDLQSFG